MRKLTANSLRDFQTCALLYSYRHGENPLKETYDLRDRRSLKFEETIKRVAAFFFYKKQSSSEPSYNSLQNRWQKLWFTEGISAADIAVMRNEVAWLNDVSYTSQAANALLVFYEYFTDDTSEVLLIDEPFNVPIGKEAYFDGSFDLITRRKKPNGFYRYDVYKWITSNFKRSPYYWIFDLAINDFAFKYRNNNTALDVHHHLWNFGMYMPGDKEILVERKDIEVLKYWSNELINEEIFAPRRGLTYYCRSCPFDLPCSRWSISESVKVEVMT